MSDSLEKPWSNNPNAPQIPPSLYNAEREFFASYVVGGILYGMPTYASLHPHSPRSLIYCSRDHRYLVFQCIGALINPANGMRRNVKLGLVAYTLALFLFMTISMAMGRDLFSTIYIDIRNFPGTEEYVSGPLGGSIIYSENNARVTLISFSSPVNQWLSDGLLVSSISNSAACARYIRSSSCIVAMLSMP